MHEKYTRSNDIIITLPPSRRHFSPRSAKQ